MIRVLIADDHAIVREGLKRIMADTPDIVVAGEASSGAELLRTARTGAWDVVLMDLALPDMSGLELLPELRRECPDLPVLVLSMYPEEQYAVRAVKAGAAGYVHKGNPPDELITALRVVADGKRYISAGTAACLAAHVDTLADKPPHEALSNREYQVLCLLAGGHRVSDIARELALSVKTVSTFRTRILEKLGLRHNAELTRYALQHGLVE